MAHFHLIALNPLLLKNLRELSLSLLAYFDLKESLDFLEVISSSSFWEHASSLSKLSFVFVNY